MLGDNIKSRRKSLGLRQIDLAEKAGITVMTVQRYEKKKDGDSILQKTVEKIANALETSVMDLVYGGRTEKKIGSRPLEDYEEIANEMKILFQALILLEATLSRNENALSKYYYEIMALYGKLDGIYKEIQEECFKNYPKMKEDKVLRKSVFGE